MLPPEINSGRMYAGPGAGPLLAAASAWLELASDLALVAAGYDSVISELSGSAWIGPASASMLAAAVPYISWLSATAAQAEAAGQQASAAAAAYEAAFALTLPPPVIAANRALLLALIATNIFGQNTPAIAATETQYAEMWAQDAAAMYDYAGSSTIASILRPFAPPPSIANVASVAGQAAAVARAAATSAGMAWLLGDWPDLTPAQEAALVGLLITAEGFIYDGGGYTLNVLQVAGAMMFLPSTAAAFDPAAGILGPVSAIGAGFGRGGGMDVSAYLSQSTRIGRMSVPPSWAPSAAPRATHPPLTSRTVVQPGSAGGPASLLRGVPTRGASRGAAAYAQRRQGFSPTVMQRPVAAG